MTEKLTPIDYAGWITARRLADKFYALQDFTASVNSLADKLRVGLVHAAAGYVSVNLSQADRGPVRIPREHWKEIKALARDDLWQTGQVSVWVQEHLRSEKVRYDYHDVRFELSGVGEMLATMMPAPSPPLEFLGGLTSVDEDAAQTAIDLPELPDKRPRVTDPHLRAWHDVYMNIYGDKQPLPHAVASAKGMFPDKSVGRDRVRDLFPERKRGPKG